VNNSDSPVKSRLLLILVRELFTVKREKESGGEQVAFGNLQKISRSTENFSRRKLGFGFLKIMFMRISSFLPAFALAVLLTGCKSTYITPSGRPVDLSVIASHSMQESFAAKPAAGFPAGIAAVRVQASLYRDFYTDREGGVYGHGRYSVIFAKEVEDDSDFERIGKLPQVGGVVTLSSLLLPQNLESDRELREAAARLKADMVLLYTFDTSFHNNDSSVALDMVSLGFFPDRKVSVHVMASALVMDTRTGFIYAALEANEKRQLLSNVWESDASADRARLDAEKAAFKSLIGEFEKSWPQIVERAHKGS
jgi:hypothetical protein